MRGERRDSGSNDLRYTSSGIPMKPYYTPQDMNEMDYGSSLGNPGEYPFTRGIHPLGYRKFAWQNAMISGYGLPEEANQREKYLRDIGAVGYGGKTSINFAFDNPCQNGYDSDHPLSKYEVGTGGIFINSLQDAEILFDGFDIGNLNVGFIIDTPGPIILAIYVALADKLGVSRDKLRGIVCNSPWRRYYTGVAYPFPPEHALRVASDCIVWAAKEVPNFNTYSLNGYDSREGGATAAQEMTIAIAPAIEVARKCIEIGGDVDEFIPNFNFFLGFHDHFFEEIAKIRAGRRIWARVVKEKLGAKKEKSCWMKIHLQTGGSTLTAQEPLNNITRVAIQALGAVMAGVQSMSSDSYDEAISLPTEEAVRVAVKTQKIIEHETGLTDVADPLGGSYYVEYLTNEMEERIQGYIDKIEAMGGFCKAILNGYIEREVANSALRYQRDFENGERIKVGVNKYVEEEKVPCRPFEYNPRIREIETERLSKWREERDNQKVQKSLADLREAAITGDWLMPRYIEAAKAGTTMGEMIAVLREVFGVYQPQNLLATV